MRLPRFVQIEPVGQCNLRCQMCPVQFRQDGPGGAPAFMPYETFTRLIDEFATATELHLQGLGEPFMHPRLLEMVGYASAKGIRVSVNSNMTLFSPRRAGLCVDSGLAEVSISIDSPDPATYEQIRLGARFNRVANNVALLRAAKLRLQSRRPDLRIVAVLMRKTLPGLPDLVRLAHSWGIERIWVQHLCHDFAESSLPAHYRPMREFVDDQTLTGDGSGQVEEVFGEAQSLAEHLGVELRLPHPQPRPHPPGTPGPKRCDWPWSRAYISYQGLAMPCCIVATPDRINFGNTAAGGFQQIWDSEPYEQFRDALSSEEPPEVCKACSVYRQTF